MALGRHTGHRLVGPGPGRPKGSKNKHPPASREFWSAFFQSEEYRENAKRRILQGRGAHIESYWVQLEHGKALDRVEHSGTLTIQCELPPDDE